MLKLSRITIIFFCSLMISSSCKQNAKTEEQDAQSDQTENVVDSNQTVMQINSEATDESIFLKFNPVSGKTYQLTMDMSYAISSKMGEQEMKQNMSMQMQHSMKIKQNDGVKNIVADINYKKIKMAMEMGGMKMQYESGVESTDMMAKEMGKVFDAFINVPLTFTFDQSGQITEAAGFELIQKKIAAQYGEQATDMMGQMDNMEDNMQGSFAYLPNKEIKVGDSWQQTKDISMQQMPIQMTTTYTLVDRQDGIATLQVKSVMKLNEKKKSKEEMDAAGVENMSMSGTANGTMYVEESTGWTLNGTMNQDMKMEVSAQGQKMPMTMKGTLKMKSE